MADQATLEFFRRQLQEPENQVCADFGTANPQWASVSHGCYISLESSGVHRSLGVHISFVRSTVMDSWKPVQLKVMELGGNQRLKAFFRQHNIPDDMPIAQKYNTRAAEWYRRNLRALAEGVEPPPPLPEGTGHLPADGAPAALPVSFARPSSLTSAGGAFASDARHYGGGGYHEAGASERSEASSASRRHMDGFGSDGPARSSRRPMDGFGNGGPGGGSSAAAEGDFLSGILGRDVGAKVSTGVWSAVGLVGSLASQAKSMAESRVQQAQQERWLDVAFDAAKQGVGAAVEAGKATYSYVNDSGGQAALGKTAEVIGSTAKRSISMVGSGAEWVSEQMGGLGGPNDTAAGLQALSSGRMRGFGPEGPAPAPRGVTDDGGGAGEAAPCGPSRLSYHLAPGPELPPRKPSKSAGDEDSAPSPPPSEASPPRPTTPAPPSKAASVWNDDDWGELK